MSAAEMRERGIQVSELEEECLNVDSRVKSAVSMSGVAFLPPGKRKVKSTITLEVSHRGAKSINGAPVAQTAQAVRNDAFEDNRIRGNLVDKKNGATENADESRKKKSRRKRNEVGSD